MEQVMRDFVRWVATQKEAPYGTIAYWAHKYVEEHN